MTRGISDLSEITDRWEKTFCAPCLIPPDQRTTARCFPDTAAPSCCDCLLRRACKKSLASSLMGRAADGGGGWVDVAVWRVRFADGDGMIWWRNNFASAGKLEGKKIQVGGSRCPPEVQTIGADGKTKSVVEVERKPNGARNRTREAEYNNLGVQHTTRPLPSKVTPQN